MQLTNHKTFFTNAYFGLLMILELLGWMTVGVTIMELWPLTQQLYSCSPTWITHLQLHLKQHLQLFPNLRGARRSGPKNNVLKTFRECVISFSLPQTVSIPSPYRPISPKSCGFVNFKFVHLKSIRSRFFCFIVGPCMYEKSQHKAHISSESAVLHFSSIFPGSLNPLRWEKRSVSRGGGAFWCERPFKLVYSAVCLLWGPKLLFGLCV